MVVVAIYSDAMTTTQSCGTSTTAHWRQLISLALHYIGGGGQLGFDAIHRYIDRWSPHDWAHSVAKLSELDEQEPALVIVCSYLCLCRQEHIDFRRVAAGGDRLYFDGMVHSDEQAEFKAAVLDKVKGQDPAVDLVCDTIFAGYSMSQRTKPVSAFLFVGPPGTGKTYLTKQIAGYLFDSEDALLTFDGANNKSPESMSNLLGHPPGYQGSDKGGQLTRSVMNRGESVLLFDEWEKATPETADVFLTMLNDGYVQERSTRKKVDFTSTVVIVTCNKDHEEVSEIAANESDLGKRTTLIKQHFNASKFLRPEILDRFDHCVVFQPLDSKSKIRVAGHQIAEMLNAYSNIDAVYFDTHLLKNIMLDAEKQGRGVRGLGQLVRDRIAIDLAEIAQSGGGDVPIFSDADGRARVERAETCTDPKFIKKQSMKMEQGRVNES